MTRWLSCVQFTKGLGATSVNTHSMIYRREEQAAPDLNTLSILQIQRIHRDAQAIQQDGLFVRLWWNALYCIEAFAGQRSSQYSHVQLSIQRIPNPTQNQSHSVIEQSFL